MTVQSTYSLDFDGSGEVDVSGMSVPASDLTLSIWVKTTDSAGDKGVFGRWDGAGFMFYKNGADLYFFCGSGSQSVVWSGGGTTIGDGSWHHIAGTKSGTTGTIYHNGSSVASGTVAAAGSPGNVGAIGTYNGRSGSRITAKLDDAALFDTALSSGTISGIYAGSTDVSTLSPVGLWIRDDPGSGTTTTDQGSGGHNGSLSGGVTWSADVPTPLAGGGGGGGGIIPQPYYPLLLGGIGGPF